MLDGRDKLRAWTLVDELVLEVYSMLRKLPANEPGDLPSALRNAALRAVIRIVEGVHGRSEAFHLSLRSSLGALAEVRYYLYLARRLGLMDLRRYRLACARQDRAQKYLREMLGPAGAGGDGLAARSPAGEPAADAPDGAAARFWSEKEM